MANYIIDASMEIQEFLDRLIKNENAKNPKNEKMIKQEQEQIIKNVKLKIAAIERHLQKVSFYFFVAFEF